MKVILAKTAGFCFGVKRAVKLAEMTADSGIPCATLGPIIHNRHVVSELENKGVFEISDLFELKEGHTVIIRSHGVGKNIYDQLEDAGIPYVDATCPDVAKIHKIVSGAGAKCRVPVIIGTRDHPEVSAIANWCDDCLIFETSENLDEWLQDDPNHRNLPITVVSQTTITLKLWNSCIEIIKKECTNYEIFDTICNATEKRQQEADELSETCDAMIVIGDANSSNTKKLAEICGRKCKNVSLIDNAGLINLEQFEKFSVVGITAGASTPAWIIKEVCDKMSDEIMMEPVEEESVPVVEGEETEANMAAQESAEEESFEELLEKSIKTLNTGEKVTGIITAITPTEVYVDLGAKQAGYITMSEISDDPTVKAEDLFKVGDEIETYILRVNDVEGTVMLSKKRLDTVKSWDDVEQAREAATIIEGYVTEENKGGIVASVKGVRVFIPASQTGLAKDVPMSSLLKTKVRMRITEVNRARRRVVGSIRAILFEERKEKAEKVWAEIEEGKKYTGTVKSLTSYGAFVDIGGVDGMVHVSELSWSRIKHPSEVISVGDTIDVFVISLDRENKKISLGYKTRESNPWNKFVESYKVGDIVPVKIVKLMSFGAFAQVLPGVDGLIHISQISDHRINKPEDELKAGQEVQVKITDIDMERQKISLSIRAILEETAQAKATQEDEVVAVFDGSEPVEEPIMEEKAEEIEESAEEAPLAQPEGPQNTDAE